MGKDRGKPKPGLGGLADALLKAGVVEPGDANRARADRSRERKELGSEGLAARAEAREEAWREKREGDAQASREREASLHKDLDETQVRAQIRGHLEPARGNKRWFYVTRDGRIPFMDVDDTLMRLLTEGDAGIVESLGVVAETHVIVSSPQALALLQRHDPEMVRFWNARKG